MNLQGWAGDKRRNVLLGDCFESCGHRFTGDPGLKGVQISFPSGCFSAERPRSLATTCFWHQRLLRSRRAKSAEGMVVKWIGPFGLMVLAVR